MAKQNPFHLWLGLPVEVVDPNHYQLLGVPRDENDRENLALAAKSQLKKLQAADVGKHLAVKARMEKRIRKAYAVLSDPKLRGQYDRQLGGDASKSGKSAVSVPSVDPASPQQLDDIPVARILSTDGPGDLRGEHEVPRADPASSGDRPPEIRVTRRPVRPRGGSPLVPFLCGVLAVLSAGGGYYIWQNWEQWTGRESDPVAAAGGSGGSAPAPDQEDSPSTPLVNPLKVDRKGRRIAGLIEDSDLTGNTDPRSEKMADGEGDPGPSDRAPRSDSRWESVALTFPNQVRLRWYVEDALWAMRGQRWAAADQALQNAGLVVAETASRPEQKLVADQQPWLQTIQAMLDLRPLVEGFWKQVRGSALSIPGGQEFLLDDQVLGFVEGTGESVTFRGAGRYLKYPFEEIPLDLAILVGEDGAKPDVPTWRLQQAAVLALHDQDRLEYASRALDLAEQAAADGHQTEAVQNFLRRDWSELGMPEERLATLPEDELNLQLDRWQQEMADVRGPMTADLAAGAMESYWEAALAAQDPARRISAIEGACLAAAKTRDARLLERTLREAAHWLEREPDEGLDPWLMRMGKQHPAMDDRQRRDWILLVGRRLSRKEVADENVARTLGEIADEICSEYDYSTLAALLPD